MEFQELRDKLTAPWFKRIPWRLIGEIALVVILLLAASSAWYNWRKPAQTITRTEYQTLRVEEPVEKIKLVKVPGPTQIVTIEKKAVADKLDMPWLLDAGQPAPVQGKPEELQAVANVDIPKTNSGVSAVAVTNTTTGKTDIVVKEKPLSLFGFPNDIRLMVRYGLSSKCGQKGNLSGQWDFFRIGKLNIGAYADVSTEPEATATVAISYDF
ncbi:MAG: hypothetical protein FD174_2565 [Geobacteraceae bacterium]|nr:MAG: hypothetical protein FD174_2565 [Geobacteraceae bacterium]